MAKSACSVEIVTLNGLVQLKAPEPNGDFEMRNGVPYFYHYLNVGDLVQVFDLTQVLELGMPPQQHAYVVRPTQEWTDRWNHDHSRVGLDRLCPKDFGRHRLNPGDYVLVELEGGVEKDA
jgi:hypothetical protein